MKPIISVRNLSKQYRLGQSRRRTDTLRDTLTAGLRAPVRYLRGDRTRPANTIWALKDVSFDIMPGEVVGIVGRNGAGKSTLLKVLSRITEPTEGEVDLYGRVGSLLEVGTGFHNELSGRENIYLNGAILGMTRAEINRKFDQIVAFAEVEKFLDTPVKHYSSGMYVRLAFAVAAHLQPEILILDEVLAVGDVEFQKKCIGSMEGAAKSGSTVLVVSHNLATIRALCTKAALLDAGKLVLFSSPEKVLTKYVSEHQRSPARHNLEPRDLKVRSTHLDIRSVRLEDSPVEGFAVHWRAPIRVVLEGVVHHELSAVIFGVAVKTVDGTPVTTSHSDLSDTVEAAPWDLQVGPFSVEFMMKGNLRPGTYNLDFGAALQQHLGRSNLFSLENIRLEVLPYAEDGAVARPSCPGLIDASATWGLEQPSLVAERA